MNKVVPISSRQFLGTYYAQNGKRIPEETSFYVGVFLTVMLPQIICAAYGWFIPFITLAVITAVGSVIGLAMYRQVPRQVTSCCDIRTVPQTPTGERSPTRNAA